MASNFIVIVKKNKKKFDLEKTAIKKKRVDTVAPAPKKKMCRHRRVGPYIGPYIGASVSTHFFLFLLVTIPDWSVLLLHQGSF